MTDHLDDGRGTDPALVAAVEAVYARHNRWVPAHKFAEDGWTAAEVQRLAAIAHHGITHQTPAIELVDFSPGADPAATLFDALRNDVDSMTSPAHALSVASRQTALAWVALAVTAPDMDAWDDIARVQFPTIGSVSADESPQWLALGEFGTLAYAAGLTLAEATARHEQASGTQDLHTLAALRGWSLL